jgi:glycosyltransferase involved in cell wall biosynthesis
MGAKCPVIVVPNAVDIKHFTKEYSESEIGEVKNKLNKKDGDIMLITTSRLVSKNAVEDIVKSMPLLPENIKLVIAGRGYMEESIKKLSIMLGVDSRINFIGWLSHAEMPKYLKASDIFIRTPISEGFGNSYVEAMACGLPCVATPVGGILDFIKDRETGMYAEVRNHQSIANAIMELVRNPDLVSKIKRQSFEMVKEKYDWELIAMDMKKVFETI